MQAIRPCESAENAREIVNAAVHGPQEKLGGSDGFRGECNRSGLAQHIEAIRKGGVNDANLLLYFRSKSSAKGQLD